MESQRVGVIGPGGFYGRVDPKNKQTILFDRTEVDEQAAVELTKPDDRFALRFIAADVILNGAPRWLCGTDRNRQFETRAASARGPHEEWTLVKLPNGQILAYVLHEADGRAFTSAPLTVVAA